ncbi:MAG: hypothetical protein AAF431_08840 [Pseudomonadota bacterium]
MNLNPKMVDLLHEIRRIEPMRKSRQLNVPSSELGNKLIQYYYQTSNLRTRQLITEFMNAAGFVWIKKLVTKDLNPVSDVSHFSSLDEYIALAAANDPRTQWASNAG